MNKVMCKVCGMPVNMDEPWSHEERYGHAARWEIMQDHAARMAAREALEAAGAAVESYQTDGMILHVKVGCFTELCRVAKELGADIQTTWYFPLGSDNPAPEWRHEMHPYTKANGHQPGFWLSAKVQWK